MAKAKTAAPDAEPKAPEQPDAASSAAPEPAKGQADAAANTGTAVYPPGPSDQAGEKTDNVPPAKKLPPDPPAEAADLRVAYEAQLNAMAAALRNLGVNPEPICDEAVAHAGFGERAKAATGPTRKALVTPIGGAPVEVEFAADAKDPSGAAIAAYKDKCGVWHLPQQPNVELK